MSSVQGRPRPSPSSHEVQEGESECGGAFTEVLLVLLTPASDVAAAKDNDGSSLASIQILSPPPFPFRPHKYIPR